MVSAKVSNLGLKRNVEDLVKRLRPMAIALDHLQGDGTNIATAVDKWKVLQDKLI